MSIFCFAVSANAGAVQVEADIASAYPQSTEASAQPPSLANVETLALLRQILEVHEPKLLDWDSMAVSQSRHDCDRSPGELKGELVTQRKKSVSLVRSLEASQLTRSGEHPRVGRLRLRLEREALEW